MGKIQALGFVEESCCRNASDPMIVQTFNPDDRMQHLLVMME